MSRSVVIFRQERDERRRALLVEVRKGRLRQGWGYRPTFDLRQDKRRWMRAYREYPVEGDAPKSTYEKIAGMLRVQPGDLLVVPNQPDDQGFLTCESVATQRGGAFPCYDFIAPLRGDFRHCTAVNPASVREHRYTAVPEGIRAALTSRYYRSPVQFVRDGALANRFRDLVGTRRRGAVDLPPPQAPPVDSPLAPFVPKSDSDCYARIRGGIQVKTRHHETLVRAAGAFLRRRSVAVHNRHPIDLFASQPLRIIFEAKVAKGNIAARVREAVGQLHWYRYKFGPSDSTLCVLLDKRPSQSVIDFVERGMGLKVVWLERGRLCGGAQTSAAFSFLNP